MLPAKATLTFDTPRENYNQDFEYRIEARVTDSSRREIVSSDTVRVTRQRYYVYPVPGAEHLSTKRQSHRRHQGARRERTTGDHRGHRQSHPRLLVGSVARPKRPRGQRRRACACSATRPGFSTAGSQRSEALATQVSRLSTRRHPDADVEDRCRRLRHNCNSRLSAKATIAWPGKAAKVNRATSATDSCHQSKPKPTSSSPPTRRPSLVIDTMASRSSLTKILSAPVKRRR